MLFFVENFLDVVEVLFNYCMYYFLCFNVFDLDFVVMYNFKYLDFGLDV